MSRMTRDDWMVYGILRTIQSKAAAEKYRHERNAKNAKYGIGLHREDSAWDLVKDYGIDGMLVKQFLTGEWDADALRHFQDAEWIELPYSCYDCTGHLFSSWMVFFSVPGGVWVYHRISVDC